MSVVEASRDSLITELKMAGSLKRLLNPVENEDNATGGAVFNPANFGSSYGPWGGDSDSYNGEYPRQSLALGPQAVNFDR